MGLLRRAVPLAFPFTRAGAALWAFRHRHELKGWAGFALRAAPRLVAGDADDALAEGRLRGRLTADSRTRNIEGLTIEVDEGVATLRGAVEPKVHDAVVAVAASTKGITRVRDELADTGRWRPGRRR